MNALTTKQKIVEAAIQLFNTEGVANVRLQQIADGAGISVGNLAYHFKNKEAIVSAVYESLFEELIRILSTYMASPALSDFDQQLAQYHHFFSNNKFYLIDLFEIERSYPFIMERWHQFVSKMLIQIRKRIDFGINRGLIQPEPVVGIYNTITNNIWMTIVFWTPQQVLKGLPANGLHFRQAVWTHLTPYFTDAGLQEFELEVQPMILH
jgi:AcrR family transcriptional regulator